ISFDDDSIPAHLLTLSPSADITSKIFDKTEKNLLSVEKMEHINTNVISNVEQEMDAQKVAINKESEFKLTRDELEHIAHVSYMAEEEFGKFQTKLPIDKDWVEEEGTKSGYEEYSVEESESEKFSRTSSATSGPDSQQQSVDMTINPIQNILPFDATDNMTLDDKNVLTKDMEHEMDITNDRISFDDDSIPAHLLTLSPSADITSECWIVEDDENSMLLFGHRNRVVKSIRMLNIEDHKMKIFNQIQKNIQTDQTIYDNGCSMSNPLTDSYSPIIQVLFPETEMTYTEFEQFHSVYNSYVKIPKSAEGTATVKSVKELEKQKSSRIGYTAGQKNIEFHTVESGSGDSDHSRRTEAGADATILLETGVSSEVVSGVMITNAAVNDQLALSGITDKSFAHFNIPQVVGIGPATSIDYFNEKQHRQNESRHINTMMKQELPKQQSKLGAAIQECGSELTMKDFKNSKIVLSDKSLSHLEKKFAFQKPWEQRTEQEKHQEQSIIGKSMMELLKDNSFVGRNEQLFKDNVNNFPKSNCKCSETVEGEQGVILGKNTSYSRIQPNGEIEFSLEHSNHYLTDGFNVTSTVTYTDRLYKKMTRNLRFSEKMPHYGRANFWKTFNNDEEYSVKTYIEGMKPSFTRASSVFVVYTDQNLLASQFGTSRKAENSDGVEETLDDGDKSKSNATRKAGNLKEIGIKINPIEHRHLTSDLITSVSALEEKWKRSEVFYLSGSVLSDSTFTKTENAKGKESLERDSTWLLKNEKPRGTYRMNVFERCERESIVGDGSMLHHADCLMRLNFFAERITEQVAELAAVELGNHFRAELNPRARYFSEMRANIDSQAESAPVTPSESDEEIERKIALGLTEKREPHLVTVPESESSPRSSSWFSLFGGGTFNREDRPRSPISFLWRTSQRQSDASSRKSSPDGRNEFMDLLRRTSGASSNGSDMSTKLPDSALAGLSNEERNHIEKVLSAANRRSRSSQSTPTASRKQSMYKLPDMNDFELCERTHIEGVIEKAEKGEFPFVIKVTNADAVKDDSVDVADVKKFDSAVAQTSGNTNQSEELLNGKSTVILEIPLGSICLSEELEEQQIVEAIVPEIGRVKFEQESSLDVKLHIQDSRSRSVSYKIPDAELEHIRKVEEAAIIMGADIKWINCSKISQEIVENLQNSTHTNSLRESEAAEKLSVSESSIDWRSEANMKDALTVTVFPVEKEEPGKTLNTKETIYETRKGETEDKSEVNSMGDANSLHEIPSLESFVIKTISFEDVNKANFVTAGKEGIKISRHHEGLRKKLTGKEVIHNEELKEQMNQSDRLDNSISRKMVENRTVNLSDEELEQIRLVNEQAKQLDKLDEFSVSVSGEIEKYKYQKTQPYLCVIEEELGQNRAAEEESKDSSFLDEKINKQKEEKDECSTRYNIQQTNALEEEAKGMDLFAIVRAEERAIVRNPRENKDIRFPEKILIRTVERTQQLEENGMCEKKETEIMQQNVLTEEELMQIQAVERRAKQMEQIFSFEGQFTKMLEGREVPDLTVNKLVAVEKLGDRLTEEELEHIKEVERNAIWEFEMPLLERFNAKNDMIGEINEVEFQQKDVALGEVAFDKFTSMLNPLKNTVITTLSFNNKADKAKLTKNAESAEDISKTNMQICGTLMKAYSENQNFDSDISTANESNIKVLATTTKDLTSVQTVNEYPENQDSEYISSTESSNFGPGTSDEDEETDKNNLESTDISPETVSSTSELKNGTTFSKVKEPTAKEDTNKKDMDLSLEVISNTTDTELLPNSGTEVFSQSKWILDMASSSFLIDVTHACAQLDVKDSLTDKQSVDRFAGLTKEEIEHIKMVDLQFEHENAEDKSEVSMHNNDDSEVNDIANFVNEMIVENEEYELQKKDSTIDATELKTLHIIDDDDKVINNTDVNIKYTGDENILHDEIPLKKFTTNDTLLERSVERDLRAHQQSKLWQNAHVEQNNEVKSLEELRREINIGKWYEEEHLSSLRKSLCAEETAEIPGFDLKLYNLTIITFFRFIKI
ncbi:unnamed protein product, partial [Brugia pahangi]|uniref:Centrosomal protein of 192 kDa n=1 Tax=Brugia pahangi TaxID=6280 RepID=A0A0N4TKP1_BRUPA